MRNDERREVAARLRECSGLHEFAEIFGFDWKDESDWHWSDVAAKVAGLIEPEPERTCKNELTGNPNNPEDVWVRCSVCKEAKFRTDNYCPRCGARVKEG